MEVKFFATCDFGNSKPLAMEEYGKVCVDKRDTEYANNKQASDDRFYYSYPYKSLFSAQDIDLQKNITNTVLETVDYSKYASGGEAMVFEIDEFPQYVLRVNKNAYTSVIKRGNLDGLMICPIVYENNILTNKNLGLPIYVIQDNAADFKKSVFSPKEASRLKDSIMLLKKVPGVPITSEYIDLMGEFMGVGEKPNHIQQKNFMQFMDLIKDKKRAEDFLTDCKEQNIPEGELFYKNYKNFCVSYLNTLDKIANMPKVAYDNAISTIKNAYGYKFDFINSDNILADFETGEFNFVDLQFDPGVFDYYECEHLIESFKDALLGGKCAYGIEFKEFGELLIYKEDKEKYEKLKNEIEHKCGCN